MRRYFEARQPFPPPPAPNKVGPISEQLSWPVAWGQHHMGPKLKCYHSSCPRGGVVNPRVLLPPGLQIPTSQSSGSCGDLSQSHWQHDIAVKSPRAAAMARRNFRQIMYHSDL